VRLVELPAGTIEYHDVGAVLAASLSAKAWCATLGKRWRSG